MEEYIRGLIKDEDDLLIELEKKFAKENSVPIIHIKN